VVFVFVSTVATSTATDTLSLHDALPISGGKQQLLADYEEYFPTGFRRYFEPFLGGGAVFFHLWKTGRLSGAAYLFDNNEELINRSEEHTSELQSRENLVCRLLLEKKKIK